MNNWICPKCKLDVVLPTDIVSQRKCCNCGHKWHTAEDKLLIADLRIRVIVQIEEAILELKELGIECSFDKSSLIIK